MVHSTLIAFVLLQANLLTAYEPQYFPLPLHPFDNPPHKLYTYEQLQGKKIAYLTPDKPIQLVSNCTDPNQTYKLQNETIKTYTKPGYRTNCKQITNNHVVPLQDSEYAAFHCGSNQTNIFIRQLFSSQAVSGLPLKEEGQLDITIYLQDALSYRHFQRTHPRTRQFFKELEATGKFRVFEFRNFHAVGKNSIPNKVPLYTMNSGKTAYNPIPPPKTWLWTDLRQRGFVSMHAEGECSWDNRTNPGGWSGSSVLSRGNITGISHFFPAGLWCGSYFSKLASHCGVAGSKLGTFTTGSNGGLPLCFGHKIDAEYLQDYNLQFFENYKRYRKFSTIMVLEAHEDTMRNAYYMDDITRHYIQEFTERFGNNSIFVHMSDHGLHYGSYLATFDGMVENYNPFLNLVVPTWLLQRFPEIGEDTVHSRRLTYPETNLEHNSKYITTSYDLFQTIHHISMITRNSSQYEEVPSEFGKSLFNYIPERGCNDVGIPPGLLCLYKAGVGASDKISTEHYNYSNLCVDILNKRRSEAPEDSCMEVALKNVSSFYHVMQDGRVPIGFPIFTVTSNRDVDPMFSCTVNLEKNTASEVHQLTSYEAYRTCKPPKEVHVSLCICPQRVQQQPLPTISASDPPLPSLTSGTPRSSDTSLPSEPLPSNASVDPSDPPLPQDMELPSDASLGDSQSRSNPKTQNSNHVVYTVSVTQNHIVFTFIALLFFSLGLFFGFVKWSIQRL